MWSLYYKNATGGQTTVKDTRFAEESSTLFQWDVNKEHKVWVYENVAAHMILFLIDLSGGYLFVCFHVAELNINRLNSMHESES